MPERDDEEATQQSITELVRLLLDVRGPKKVELADALGISPASLSHSLSDPGPRRRPWRAHEVLKIARYYEISTDALFGDDDAREEVLRELENLALDAIAEVREGR